MWPDRPSVFVLCKSVLDNLYVKYKEVKQACIDVSDDPVGPEHMSSDEELPRSSSDPIVFPIVIDVVSDSENEAHQEASTEHDSENEAIPLDHPICELKKEFISKMDDECRKLSEKYRTSVNNEYSGLLTQAGYVKMAVTIQADLVFDCLKTLQELEMSIEPEFNFVSIGSGPGTDMLGVYKFFKHLELGRPDFVGTKVTAYHYDIKENWEPVLRHFEAAISASQGPTQTKLEMKPGVFTKFDFAKDEFKQDSPGFADGQLYSFVYLFSELITLTDEEKATVEKNLLHLINAAGNRSIFLFIDRRAGTARTSQLQKNLNGVPLKDELTWIQEIAQKAYCLQKVHEKGITDSDINYQLSPDEEKTDLCEYFTASALWPRLRTCRFSIVYQKVKSNSVLSETNEIESSTLSDPVDT